MSGDPILAALVRLEAGQARLDAGQARLNAGLTRLETEQATLRTDFMAEIASTRGAIMERIDRLQDRFGEMNAEVNASFNNIARVEDKLMSTQNELRAMVEQYNYLHRRMTAMDARLQALEDKPHE